MSGFVWKGLISKLKVWLPAAPSYYDKPLFTTVK